jgi:chloride channel protein, CIC family
LQDKLAFTSPPQLLFYVVLGVLSGFIGLAYAKGFYGLTHIFHRLPLPNWLKPGIGGLLVGLIGLLIPQALGMGYGWVQQEMGVGLFSIPVWVILILPFVKILTTGLSIGSGGSGGIFGPGMVIGGSVGAALWRICFHVVPGVPPTPAPFVIIGMMATFGGIAHAPLAVMLMVAEMTGNLSLLAPAMIAVGISSVMVGKASIYTSQVDTRADSPAHRLEYSLPVLATIPVASAMTKPLLTFLPNQTVAQAEAMLDKQTVSGGPVLDERGDLQGVLTLADIRRIPLDKRNQVTVGEAMNRSVFTITPDETLDEALEQLTSHRVGWAPVVDVEIIVGVRHVVGLLTVADIVRTYRAAVAKDTRLMRGLVEGTVMIETKIEPGMPIAGKALRDAHLPKDTLVVSIRRNGEFIFPRGGAVIEPGDVVTFLVSPDGEDRLQQYLAQRPAEKEPVTTDKIATM